MRKTSLFREYQPGRFPYARGLVPGDRHDGTVGEGRHRSHIPGMTEQHAAQFVRLFVHADTTQSPRFALGRSQNTLILRDYTSVFVYAPHKYRFARAMLRHDDRCNLSRTRMRRINNILRTTD